MFTRQPKLIALLILSIGVILCWLTVSVGLANIARSRPQHAFANLEFSDARLLGRKAEMILASSQEPAATARAVRYAELALKRDPTVISAIVTIATSYELKKQNARALKLMRYSEKMSRRDFATHYWFIDYETSRNNLLNTLDHYDAALRTSSAAEPILMPILISALADPDASSELVGPLSTVLARKPAWAYTLVNRSTNEVQSTATLMSLASALRLKGFEIDPEPKQTLINRAVADGLYNDARRLSGQPLHNANIYNGNFGKEPAFAPFDWVLVSDPELGSERVVRSEDGSSYHLYLSAGSGRAGILAKQLLMLKPGQYGVSAVVSNVPDTVADRPLLRVRCASKNEVILVLSDFPQATATPKGFNLNITVPSADCSAQWIEVSAKASNKIGGTQSYLESIAISKMAMPN